MARDVWIASLSSCKSSHCHAEPSHHYAGPSGHQAESSPHHIAEPSHHHAGLSCPTNNDDAMLSDDSGPSSLPNNDVDVVMGETFNDEVYGLSQLCYSGWIANHIEQLGQKRWGSNGIISFANKGE